MRGLTAESKRALLEQALKIKPQGNRTPKCFTTILFASRGFLFVSRRDSIYRLVVDIRFSNICIWFEDHRQNSTRGFCCDFEKAKRFLQKLMPNFFVVRNYTESQQIIVDLLENMNWKIALPWVAVNNVYLDLFRHIWPHLTEIEFSASTLHRLDSLRVKSFDKLKVRGMTNEAELKRTLRHSAKNLSLIAGDFRQCTGMRNYVYGEVENCSIVFLHWSHRSNVASFIKTLVKAQPKLKSLSICHESTRGTTTWTTTQELIEKLVDAAEVINDVTEIMDSTATPSTIEVKLDYYGHLLDSGWVNQLELRAFFRDVRSNITERGNRVYASLHLRKRTPKVEVKFDASVSYYLH